jgi:hypothetical protein
MAYRLKTFRVQFVAEPVDYPAGSPCRSSEDVERIARSIYGTLDADKELMWPINASPFLSAQSFTEIGGRCKEVSCAPT